MSEDRHSGTQLICPGFDTSVDAVGAGTEAGIARLEAVAARPLPLLNATISVAVALPAIVAALLGSYPDGSARWWAWPIAGVRDEQPWLFAFATLALGAVVFASSRPKLPE